MEDHVANAYLYAVNVKGENHSIFQAPDQLKSDGLGMNTGTILNIVMVDVSGSMHCYWQSIITNWNLIVSPFLQGQTKIFTFGSEITYRRAEPVLEEGDFDSSATDLTGAIKMIRTEILESLKSNIRVFLVTDGDHNATEFQPPEEIALLQIPEGKTIEVYLLGVGMGFPVEYSISIRSALHNGNTNVPSLFWAQQNEDFETQMQDIKDILLKGFIELDLSIPGYLCPGLPTTNTIHLGEFVYFQCPPSNLEKIGLTRMIADEQVVEEVNVVSKDIDVRLLLDNVFRQWNSIIIQLHRNKQSVPLVAFEIMEDIFHFQKAKIENDIGGGAPNSVKIRLAKKRLQYLEVEYKTLMNQSKNVIELDHKFSSEIELAEAILKTTVKSKFDVKTLKMRGHGLDDYAEDITKFQEIYNNLKESVLALSEPPPEECCSVTFGSIVKDLQDESFEELLTVDKFTFLKTFCVTGIPVYAPVKDSAQINPWTMKIKNILVTPYELVSQCTLELSAELSSGVTGEQDKDVYLQEGDESSRFNAVIPVFTAEVAKTLKPLIRSNLFGMVATFCILKNAYIIDNNAHMAALSCAFLKTISENPKNDRKEFIKNRLLLIEATGNVYIDRKGYSKYVNVLLDKPCEALMTESKEIVDETTIKCESLTKPAFFLYLIRDKLSDKLQLKSIIGLMSLEFIGRCLSKYSEPTPFSDFFVPELSNKEKRKSWVDEKLKELAKGILEKFRIIKGELLSAFFKPEDLRKTLKAFCHLEFKKLSGSLLNIGINMQKVKHLKNLGAAGDVSWESLQTLAREFDVLEEDVAEIFDEKSVFVYVSHALHYKSSSDRLSAKVDTYDEALTKVKRKVESENCKALKVLATKMILEEADDQWRKQYMLLHKPFFAQPLSEVELISNAIDRGIDVDSSSFSSVYKFNPETGLTRNACMIEQCPHYLKPNRTFNQHISIERQNGFPHGLHRVSLRIATQGGSAADVTQELLLGKNSTVAGRKVYVKPTLADLEAYEKEINDIINNYKNLVGNSEPDNKIIE